LADKCKTIDFKAAANVMIRFFGSSFAKTTIALAASFFTLGNNQRVMNSK
jgi:hypothetical protein